MTETPVPDHLKKIGFFLDNKDTSVCISTEENLGCRGLPTSCVEADLLFWHTLSWRRQLQCVPKRNSLLQHAMSLKPKSWNYTFMISILGADKIPLFTITFGLILRPAHFKNTGVK